VTTATLPTSKKSEQLQTAIAAAGELVTVLDNALLAEARGELPEGLHALFAAAGWDMNRIQQERDRAEAVVRSQATAGSSKFRKNLKKRIADGEASHRAERGRIGSLLAEMQIRVKCPSCSAETGELTIDGVVVDEPAELRETRRRLATSEGAVKFLQEPRLLPEHVRSRLRDAAIAQSQSSDQVELHGEESRMGTVEALLKLRPSTAVVPGSESAIDTAKAIEHIRGVERELGQPFLAGNTRILITKEHGVKNRRGVLTGYTEKTYGINTSAWDRYMRDLETEKAGAMPRIAKLRSKVENARASLDKLQLYYVH